MPVKIETEKATVEIERPDGRIITTVVASEEAQRVYDSFRAVANDKRANFSLIEVRPTEGSGLLVRADTVVGVGIGPYVEPVAETGPTDEKGPNLAEAKPPGPAEEPAFDVPAMEEPAGE
tara:strand:+ start:210 stop:569 length:360 start_codon:yes stop_codon:yes gene_type:complete